MWCLEHSAHTAQLFCQRLVAIGVSSAGQALDAVRGWCGSEALQSLGNCWSEDCM